MILVTRNCKDVCEFGDYVYIYTNAMHQIHNRPHIFLNDISERIFFLKLKKNVLFQFKLTNKKVKQQIKKTNTNAGLTYTYATFHIF